MEVLKVNRETVIGNLSSVIKILICMIAPACAVYLGTDQDTVIALLTAIVGFLFSIVDATYPNTMIEGGTDD